jgi:chromate reductase
LQSRVDGPIACESRGRGQSRIQRQPERSPANAPRPGYRKAIPGVILATCESWPSAAAFNEQSGNLTLLNIAAASAPLGVEVILFDGLRDLPHFNPDIDESGTPDSVRQWRQALADSHAVLIASPEYGHSLPGALKNGIDWVIGSGELEQKIVAITAAVPAVDRGRRGLQALRDTLLAVRATIVGGEPISRGPQFEPQVAALVKALVDAAQPGDRISGAPSSSTPAS